MRFWVRSLLFVSAYTPLLLIFALQYFDVRSSDFWICVVALFLANFIWVPVFIVSRGWSTRVFIVKKSKNRTSDALDYIIAYIIVFLGFQLEKWQDAASIIILLTVIFFVYIHSNLLFINPVLNIFGYKIHDVEIVTGENIVLITKRFKIRPGNIETKKMSDNIYIEAPKKKESQDKQEEV
ncbi:MAG: hypothetical protein HXS54_07130 [Theionarchaea archaeon]|nr:hypothetical protein [Theionarchaea archaeon]